MDSAAVSPSGNSAPRATPSALTMIPTLSSSWMRIERGRTSGRVNPLERFQAPAGGFEFRIVAAFLLDQIVFDPASFFGRREYLFPGHGAFSEKHPIALFPAPVLQVQGIDPARIGGDPGDRIGPHFNARADIELQHEIFRC